MNKNYLNQEFKNLQQFALLNKDVYEKNNPFPHIVIDNFFSEEILNKILVEFPDLEKEGSVKKFKDGFSIKLASSEKTKFGESTTALLNYLNSSEFLNFLQTITGIKEKLLPDPYFEGGGLHEIKKGGFLKVHSDFNYHPQTNLDRRLNLLLYLNKDWSDIYGGNLELWNQDMSRCEKKITPTFNKIVIFSTTNKSFHGHPDPLACPENLSRKSIALYYYSNGRPSNEKFEARSTLYKSRPNTNEVNYLNILYNLKLALTKIIKFIFPKTILNFFRKFKN